MCSYIRISSTGQNFDRQVENLSTVVNFFSDKLSGKDKNILALEAFSVSRETTLAN